MISHIVVLSGFHHSQHLIWSVTSLSYMVFIINFTRFDRSWQFNIIFNVECTCTIGHAIVLSRVLIIHFRVWRRIDLYVGHIVVLFGFCHRSYLIQLIMRDPFRFRHRPHLYNRSWQFSIIFGVESACTISHVIVLSGFCHKPQLVW